MVQKIRIDLAQPLGWNQDPNVLLKALGLPGHAEDFTALKAMLLGCHKPLIIEVLNGAPQQILDLLEDVQQKSEHIFLIRGPVN